MSVPSNVKWVPRFKRDLDTSCKTIPGSGASEERENVLDWAGRYVKVKKDADILKRTSAGALDNETLAQLRECDEYVQVYFGRDFGTFGYEPWNEMMERYGTPEDEEGEEEIEESVDVGRATAQATTTSGTSGAGATMTTRGKALRAPPAPLPTLKVTASSPVATKGKKKGKLATKVKVDEEEGESEAPVLEVVISCTRCTKVGIPCVFQSKVRCEGCAGASRKCNQVLGSVEVKRPTPKTAQKEAKRKRDETAPMPVRMASSPELRREMGGEALMVGKRPRLDAASARDSSPVASTSGASHRSWATRTSMVSRASTSDLYEEYTTIYRKAIVEQQVKRDSAEREMANLMKEFESKVGRKWGEREQ